MSSGMPELGSKISLISKADIRYEGRLFTVDPQECTIALASVRSFGTEDRETQYPVAPQNQVYDYILFRGSDIKDIRVVNNASSLPNDPAIVQLSAPGAGGQFQAQFHGAGAGGPPHGLYAPYRPPAPALAAPGRPPRASSSVLDLIGANAAPSSGSRSATPGARKSPAQAERSTQADERPPRRPRNDERPRHDERPRNDRPRDERPRDDRPRDQRPHDQRPHDQRPHDQRPHDDHYQRQRQRPDNRNYLNHNNYGQNNHPHNQNQNHHYSQQQMHQQPYQYYRGGRGGGGWRGRGAGGRPGQPLPPLAAGAVASDGAQRPKNTLKFEDDYDFEQANTRFEELRTQLAKVKLEEAGAPAAGDEPQPEAPRKIQAAEAEKKDDSGNETGAGEAEAEEGEGGEGEGDGGEGEGEEGAYDKAKSFFDNISCEAVERSMGRSQRRDWRAERKLNSETFGVASARRAPWRGARGGWRGGWGQRGPQHYQPQHRRGQQRHHIHHSQQHQGQHQPQPQAQQGN